MFDVYLRNGRVFLAVKLVLAERPNGVGVVSCSLTVRVALICSTTCTLDKHGGTR
jgi:hypothetical protein